MTTADDLALKERGKGGVVLVGHGRRGRMEGGGRGRRESRRKRGGRDIGE